MSESMATFQNAFYIGNNFNAILYGVELVLYFMTVRAMFNKKTRQTRSARSNTFFLFFSTALLCLNTVFVATEAVFGEEMWIVNKDYPGGQDAYLNDFASVWYQTFGTAASIALNLLSDGLLIYRCFIVWSDIRIVIFPILLYLGTFSVGIAQLVVSGQPKSNYFLGLAHTLGVSYTSCVISLNLIVSGLICGCIVFRSRNIARQVGHDVGRDYVTAAAIIVESAALYALTGVAYLVAFAINSQLEVFFLSVYVMMTCIAPQMIILRVVRGRAWTRNTSAMTSTNLEFTHSAQAATATQLEFDAADKHAEFVATQQSNASTVDVV
ncbi:hypothetical protein TRAPUB_11541 [Trametes pubescens]|uniref:Uncharacterized protein n=1 Tax=Trametes pubescens TaxID=154538 RepID=A0A1M2VWB8_TRAPU|nr:hypothetical protein TRAPUB_11541 [Trametes pubescens]